MPSKPPKDVWVTVKLHPPGSEKPFEFVQKELPTQGDDVLVFENGDKTYGFQIHYVIDDTLNPGYRFPEQQTGGGHQHLDNALWVRPSLDLNDCPTKACKWAEFKPMKVLDDGKRLIVMNKNRDPETFVYTLRVTKDGDYLALDPGGVNKNGSEPYYSSYTSYAVAGAGAALATALIASSNMMQDVTINAIVAVVVGAIVGVVIGAMFGGR